MYDRSTELRKLTQSDVRKLGDVLDLSNDWKLLIGHIPVDDVSDQAKYNNEHIRLIETVSEQQKRSPTEILIDEWGTSGRKRPTLNLLLNVLVKAQLLRAADLVALKFLNEPPPERPRKGPAAPIPIDIKMETEEIRDLEAELNADLYFASQPFDSRDSSIMNNNRDNYEKYTNFNKNLQMMNNETDLITFSKSQSIRSSVENDNIPVLSALVNSEVQRVEHHSNDWEAENLTESNVPALSALQQCSATVPDLSSLLSNEDISDNSTSSSVNSENEGSSSSSNITPNINDSSLTTITETSGDNSFDMSNSSLKSNEHILIQ